MELFHEMKNRYVLCAIKAINHLQRVKNVSWKEFRTALEKEGVSLEWAEYLASVEPFARRSALGEEKTCGEPFIEDDVISLSMPETGELGGIPIRPSVAEKAWLKSALQNKYMPLFLETEEMEKLKEAVADIHDIASFQVQKSFALYPDEITLEFKSNFRLLLRAIRENRYVAFTNSAAGGRYESGGVLPVKIEYSIDEEIFRLVFYSQRENRPVKANIARLSGVTLGAVMGEEDSKVLKDLVEERMVPEPLELRVYNKFNCPERAFFLFANYECAREWKSDGKGECLEFSIRYRTFEENELIELILTLGPHAEVISPMRVRGKIVERLCACL